MKNSKSIARGGSSFFPRGGWPIVHEPILFGYFTSREAASRFFGDFTSREAASRFFFFVLFYEPRSGEPIFLAILRAAKRRADFFGYFEPP